MSECLLAHLHKNPKFKKKQMFILTTGTIKPLIKGRKTLNVGARDTVF